MRSDITPQESCQAAGVILPGHKGRLAGASRISHKGQKQHEMQPQPWSCAQGSCQAAGREAGRSQSNQAHQTGWPHHRQETFSPAMAASSKLSSAAAASPLRLSTHSTHSMHSRLGCADTQLQGFTRKSSSNGSYFWEQFDRWCSRA
jgi:hypothetical protein